MSRRTPGVRASPDRAPPPPGLFPDLAAFVAAHHRLPRLGDNLAPWHYRGWLLPYVIELHALVPAVADRWGYYLRTLEAGRLLAEPIPPIAFGPTDNRVFTLLHEWSRLVGRDCGCWSDFRTLLKWLCWGLALSDEQPRLADEVHEMLYRGVDLAPLLERPHDYLGEHVAASKARGWNPTGFFPTPHTVVECLVRMTMHDIGNDGGEPRTLSVCDPAVGSGRMLLHASNLSLNLRGQDIDPLAVAMCKINGVLYAPWLAFPFPAAIVGTHVEPLPASLPVPQPPPEGVRIYRVDDRGQGLLFDL
jgi:N-6 DNA Methylase